MEVWRDVSPPSPGPTAAAPSLSCEQTCGCPNPLSAPLLFVSAMNTLAFVANLEETVQSASFSEIFLRDGPIKIQTRGLFHTQQSKTLVALWAAGLCTHIALPLTYPEFPRTTSPRAGGAKALSPGGSTAKLFTHTPAGRKLGTITTPVWQKYQKHN